MSVRRLAALAACIAIVVSAPARADVIIPSGSVTSLDAGGLELACTDLIVAGTLHVDSASVTNVRNFTIQPGGIVDATTGTISVGGTFVNQGTLAPPSAVVFGNACGSGPQVSIPVPATSREGLLLLAALLAAAAFLFRRGHRS